MRYAPPTFGHEGRAQQHVISFVPNSHDAITDAMRNEIVSYGYDKLNAASLLFPTVSASYLEDKLSMIREFLVSVARGFYLEENGSFLHPTPAMAKQTAHAAFNFLVALNQGTPVFTVNDLAKMMQFPWASLPWTLTSFWEWLFKVGKSWTYDQWQRLGQGLNEAGAKAQKPKGKIVWSEQDAAGYANVNGPGGTKLIGPAFRQIPWGLPWVDFPSDSFPSDLQRINPKGGPMLYPWQRDDGTFFTSPDAIVAQTFSAMGKATPASYADAAKGSSMPPSSSPKGTSKYGSPGFSVHPADTKTPVVGGHDPALVGLPIGGVGGQGSAGGQGGAGGHGRQGRQGRQGQGSHDAGPCADPATIAKKMSECALAGKIFNPQTCGCEESSRQGECTAQGLDYDPATNQCRGPLPVDQPGCTPPNTQDPDLGCLTPEQVVKIAKDTATCEGNGGTYNRKTGACEQKNGSGQKIDCQPPNLIDPDRGDCVSLEQMKQRGQEALDCHDAGKYYCAKTGECSPDPNACGGEGISGGDDTGGSSYVSWVVGAIVIGGLGFGAYTYRDKLGLGGAKRASNPVGGCGCSIPARPMKNPLNSDAKVLADKVMNLTDHGRSNEAQQLLNDAIRSWDVSDVNDILLELSVHRLDEDTMLLVLRLTKPLADALERRQQFADDVEHELAEDHGEHQAHALLRQVL